MTWRATEKRIFAFIMTVAVVFAVAQVTGPLLIMQGGLDLQVTTEHFDAYKALLAGKDDVEFKQYAKLNHLFSDGKGETVRNAYMRKRKIPTEVIDDIASFVLKYV